MITDFYNIHTSGTHNFFGGANIQTLQKFFFTKQSEANN